MNMKWKNEAKLKKNWKTVKQTLAGAIKYALMLCIHIKWLKIYAQDMKLEMLIMLWTEN